MTGTRRDGGDPADRASAYLVRFRGELLDAARLGPVLDVACGDGRNGLYLARLGAGAVLVDRSEEARAGVEAFEGPGSARFTRMDLETSAPPSFGVAAFGAVLVFRYLHRPLMPALKDCLKPGGVFVYETYLEGQEAFGRPRNPDHLLRRGELAAWFGGWRVLDLFEGRLEDPPRFMGRIVCVKTLP